MSMMDVNMLEVLIEVDSGLRVITNCLRVCLLVCFMLLGLLVWCWVVDVEVVELLLCVYWY